MFAVVLALLLLAVMVVQVNVGPVELVFAPVLAAVVALLAPARRGPAVASTRAGTTTAMFVFATMSAIGGLVAAIVCFVHTASPGCPGWTGCGTSHPLVAAGIVCLAAGAVLCAIFAALGLIARSVGEMQAAAQLDPLAAVPR